MVLCDIGNTTFHFFYDNKSVKYGVEQLPKLKDDRNLFFISVNEEATKILHENIKCKNIINLEPYCDLDISYNGLGVDRAFACLSVFDGVVIDAGSAITVDVMHQGVHIGGYILPGINAIKDTYKNISPALDMSLNFAVDLRNLPFNTTDAISYGLLKSIILPIEESRKSKKIYFTGGDGKFLSKFFTNSIFYSNLVFDGMRKIVDKYDLNK
jgi:type III pantothenate kinase